MVNLDLVATALVITGTVLQFWVSRRADDLDERATNKAEKEDISFITAMDELEECDEKVGQLVLVVFGLAILVLLLELAGW